MPLKSTKKAPEHAAKENSDIFATEDGDKKPVNNDLTPTKYGIREVLGQSTARIKKSTPVKTEKGKLLKGMGVNLSNSVVKQLVASAVKETKKESVFDRDKLIDKLQQLDAEILSRSGMPLNLEIFLHFVNCDFSNLRFDHTSIKQSIALKLYMNQAFDVILQALLDPKKSTLSRLIDDQNKTLESLARSHNIDSQILNLVWDHVKTIKDKVDINRDNLCKMAKKLAQEYIEHNSEIVAKQNFAKAALFLDEFNKVIKDLAKVEMQEYQEASKALDFLALVPSKDVSAVVSSEVRKLSSVELPDSHAAGVIAQNLVNSAKNFVTSTLTKLVGGSGSRPTLMLKQFASDVNGLKVVESFYHTGSRSSHAPDIGTYEDVAKILKGYSAKYTQKSMAKYIRNSIKSEHLCDLEFQAGCTDKEDMVEAKEYLHKIGQLILLVESSREPHTIVISNMFLDLIEAGIWEVDKINELPMSVVGAVKATRMLTEMIPNNMTRKYDISGPKCRATDKPVGTILVREKAIFLEWAQLQNIAIVDWQNTDNVRSVLQDPRMQVILTNKILDRSIDWFGFEVRQIKTEPTSAADVPGGCQIVGDELLGADLANLHMQSHELA